MFSFFMKNQKNMQFFINGKIYNYPNKINCVRLALGYAFSEITEAKEEEEDEDEKEVEDNGQENNNILDKIDEEGEDEEQPLMK